MRKLKLKRLEPDLRRPLRQCPTRLHLRLDVRIWSPWDWGPQGYRAGKRQWFFGHDKESRRETACISDRCVLLCDDSVQPGDWIRLSGFFNVGFRHLQSVASRTHPRERCGARGALRWKERLRQNLVGMLRKPLWGLNSELLDHTPTP